MTKTTNYQLNQWAASDRVLREDFNEDNAKLDTILHTLRCAIPHIATGSYTGAGTYGASTPNTLTFDFQPKIIILSNKTASSNSDLMFILSGQTKYTHCGSNGGTSNGVCSWNNNSVSWYSTKDAYTQFNASAYSYCYIAIG